MNSHEIKQSSMWFITDNKLRNVLVPYISTFLCVCVCVCVSVYMCVCVGYGTALNAQFSQDQGKLSSLRSLRSIAILPVYKQVD